MGSAKIKEDNKTSKNIPKDEHLLSIICLIREIKASTNVYTTAHTNSARKAKGTISNRVII